MKLSKITTGYYKFKDCAERSWTLTRFRGMWSATVDGVSLYSLDSCTLSTLKKRVSVLTEGKRFQGKFLPDFIEAAKRIEAKNWN